MNSHELLGLSKALWSSKSKRTGCLLCLFLLGMIATPQALAQAQVPKSGKFSVHYGWKAAAQTKDLGGGATLFIGEDHGAAFNDAGSGLMHLSAVTCPQSGIVHAKGFDFRGNCVITDAEGDSIFLNWECTGPAKGPGPQEGRCAGTETIWGGTGKYEGITGKVEFHGGLIGKGPHGYSIWKGDYRMP
jgi:hypothetical protein